LSEKKRINPLLLQLPFVARIRRSQKVLLQERNLEVFIIAVESFEMKNPLGSCKAKMEAGYSLLCGRI